MFPYLFLYCMVELLIDLSHLVWISQNFLGLLETLFQSTNYQSID